MNPNIKLNVGGKRFEAAYETITKVPYFKDMFDGVGISNEEIFVNRSPLVFEHVLALAMDPLYPYPKEYAYELDFYGVIYEKDKLYDVNEKMLERIDILSVNTNSNLGFMELQMEELFKRLDNIQKELQTIKISLQTPKYVPTISSSSTNTTNNTNRIACIRGDCQKMATLGCNYCHTCLNWGSCCNKANCSAKRVNNSYFCTEHNPSKINNIEKPVSKLW